MIPLPSRDVARHIYQHYLNENDRALLWRAHGVREKLPVDFVSRAAAEGHVGLLWWHTTRYPAYPYRSGQLLGAARNNHLDVLELMDGKFSWANDQLMGKAAYRGHLRIVQWLYQRTKVVTPYVAGRAASGGHIHLLEWILSVRSHSAFLYRKAAEENRLAVIQWLLSRNYAYDEDACAGAAKGGHLELLQWLRQRGFPWDDEVCYEASANGRLRVLEWAMQNGCPWQQAVVVEAARNGHLDILVWWRANEYPMNVHECLAAAEEDGHREVVEWINSLEVKRIRRV